jgi:hypothetical protein
MKMKQRGRKSAASNVIPLSAIGMRQTINPCRRLNRKEQQLFDMIVRGCHHLQPVHAPLLTAYCFATSRMFESKNKPSFERMASTALLIARKLRITPQQMMRAEAVAKRSAHVDDDGPKPWERS